MGTFRVDEGYWLGAAGGAAAEVPRYLISMGRHSRNPRCLQNRSLLKYRELDSLRIPLGQCIPQVESVGIWQRRGSPVTKGPLYFAEPSSA